MQRARKRLFGEALLLGVAAALLVAAGSAGAAGANKDIVNGGFEDYFGEHVGLHAESGPAGEDPSGHESATRAGDTRYRLRVACLTVQGNVAAYGTVVVKSNNPDFPPGTEFVEVVRDGNLPSGAGDGWDIFDAPASTCADFLAAAAAAPAILSGNISIRDAQA
jgi:hypothetical protein